MTTCCGSSGRSCGGGLAVLTYSDESVHIQQQMVCDMNMTGAGGGLGWNHPGFTDPTTGEPLTLGQVYDRHAICMAVLAEFDT